MGMSEIFLLGSRENAPRSSRDEMSEAPSIASLHSTTVLQAQRANQLSGRGEGGKQGHIGNWNAKPARNWVKSSCHLEVGQETLVNRTQQADY